MRYGSASVLFLVNAVGSCEQPKTLRHRRAVIDVDNTKPKLPTKFAAEDGKQNDLYIGHEENEGVWRELLGQFSMPTQPQATAKLLTNAPSAAHRNIWSGSDPSNPPSSIYSGLSKDCNVCGRVGSRVTLLYAIVTIPGEDPITCSDFQTAGDLGFFDEEFCEMTPSLAAPCGCYATQAPSSPPVVPPPVGYVAMDTISPKTIYPIPSPKSDLAPSQNPTPAPKFAGPAWNLTPGPKGTPIPSVSGLVDQVTETTSTFAPKTIHPVPIGSSAEPSRNPTPSSKGTPPVPSQSVDRVAKTPTYYSTVPHLYPSQNPTPGPKSTGLRPPVTSSSKNGYPTSKGSAPSPYPAPKSGSSLPLGPTNRDYDSSPAVSNRDLLDLILSVALQGGIEFDNPNNYQSKALAWLKDNVKVHAYSDDRIIQRYAMSCIYFSTFAVRTPYTESDFGLTTPPGWYFSRGWVTDADECIWHGITCGNSNEVIGIELNENRLTGNFPPEASLLSNSLTHLNICDNLVSNPGEEYNAFLGSLTNLEYLYLHATNFEYPGIPTEIGLLSNLVELDCSYTLYDGELRGEIFENMPMLTYLDLSGNGYNSTVPKQVGDLPSLERLYIQDAYLSGDLSFMQGMESIFELWVDENPGLGGTIPSFIGKIKTLESFSIGDCSIHGTIPHQLGLLSGMQKLWLHNNKLTGMVPLELGNMVNLRHFELQLNMIAGTIPDEVCALRTPYWGVLGILEADCVGEIKCDCCTACYGSPQPSLASDYSSPTVSPKPMSKGTNIKSLVRSVALQGGAEFDDPASYQSNALTWLITSGPLVDHYSPEQIVQRYALACIFFSTFSVRTPYTDSAFGFGITFPWYISKGWVTNAEECIWYGIICDHEGAITEIDLSDNRLSGRFPPEVVLLNDSLKSLNLRQNLVSNPGDEFNSFLGRLTNLECLNIGSTNFEYPGIPSEIGLLSNLVALDCSYTLYFGKLRGEVFAMMSNLNHLSLGGNSYNTSIPDEIGRLANLETLYIENAFLTGDLSPILGLGNIKEMWLDYNPDLGGTISAYIGELTTLEILSLSECSFTGVVPSELGLLTMMQKLWLHDNKLTGQVPPEIGNMEQLKIFELEENSITGSMPNEVCNLRSCYDGGELGILEADCFVEIKCDCCTACFGDPEDNASTRDQPARPVPSISAASASRLPTVEELVRPISLGGGSEFDDPSSYQSMALAWLASTTNLIIHSKENIIQRYSLACIFFSTNSVQTPLTNPVFAIGEAIPGWKTSNLWLTEADECLWHGLLCDSNGFVTTIDLASNHLSGQFPREVKLLAGSLVHLDLSNNVVFNPGDDHNAFLGELTNLEYLSIGGTNFEYDGIPTQIGQLSKLINFNCSNTLYSGELREEIFSNMPALKYLSIGGNHYNTSIPLSISQLPKLESLHLENSGLMGDISFLDGMQSITEVWMDGNPGLGGTIPDWIGQLPNLQIFSATGCGLIGSLPSEIGELALMATLQLNNNDLTGFIPTELGNLPGLSTLRLEDNDIRGVVPEEVCFNTPPLGPLSTLHADCVVKITCSCCSGCH